MNSPPLPFSLILPSLISGVVSTGYHFCIYLYMFTFFAPYSHSYSLSLTLLLFHWCQPFNLGKTSPTVLFSNFVEEKREKIKHMT
jgi:hypothetical protein